MNGAHIPKTITDHFMRDLFITPIERYLSFKGIYLSGTGKYYLCDFYELRYASNFIVVRVVVEVDKLKTTVEMKLDDKDNWVLQSGEISPELAERLADHITSVYIKIGR
jgi:hypothetical protein